MEQFEAIFINEKTKLSKDTLKGYHSLAFAFIGDGIHTLFIRTHLVLTHNAKAGKLHTLTSQYVNATTQARAMDALRKELTSDELQIAKTARNVKNKTSAKNANLEDYKKATEFEAVLGYLYLSGQQERLEELLNKSLKVMESL